MDSNHSKTLLRAKVRRFKDFDNLWCFVHRGRGNLRFSAGFILFTALTFGVESSSVKADLSTILSTSTMADPFEVRMRFTSQLQHLNASVNSSQKAASFVLKHRDLDEDLHSCILEQLERVSYIACYMAER